MTQKLVDAVEISGTRIRDDGSLVTVAKVARTGIQIYAGHEVGRPERDAVRIYRPGEEVFDDPSMESFAHRPVTNDHPDEDVTADNWKQHAVGQSSDEVSAEGKYIRVPLMVSDAAAIKQIQNGKRELSAGYSVDLDWTSGSTLEGEAFDAIQRNIRINHIAIVQKGRAGGARIGDGAIKTWGAAPLPQTRQHKEFPMSDTLKTVVLGDKAVQVADKDAPLIEQFKTDADKRLSDAKAESENVLADAKSKHAQALADKDKELAKKDAEIDDLKGKILSDADLDKRVADRASLIDKARKVSKDIKTDGLSDAAIRRAAVTAAKGDDAAKDKSDAYIEAAFDLIADASDPVRDAIKGGAKTSTNDNGQAAYEKRLSDAWKKQEAS